MISSVLIFCTVLAYAHSIRSVCYYSNSAKYRSGIGMFTPENVDPMLCTHLVYSYAQIKNVELTPTEWDDDYPNRASGMYSKVLKLRNANPNLKVLLAVGNFMEKPDSFSPVVLMNVRRVIFARNVVKYARDRTFDGVTLEWGYLATNSNLGYKTDLLVLLKEIRAAVEVDSRKRRKARLILAVTVPAKKSEIDAGYLIPEIVQQSDFISVRAFDMRTADDKVVGLSSAFHSAPNATGEDKYLSANWVANYYTSMGIPKDKINIGISTYGRSFQLKDEKHYQIGDAAVDDGIAGPWSGSIGLVAHYEMCRFIMRGGRVVNVPAQGGRYYFNGVNWISYEDTLSVIQKACFIKQEGFGGITFWTLDLDDFSGQGCREGKYPLITTALRVMSSPDMSPCSLVNSWIYVEALSANKTESTTPPAPADSAEKMRVVCYYERLAYYRREEAQFLPEDINPDLCTHIVYAYAKLTSNNVAPHSYVVEISTPWREGLIDRFVNVRKRNPALKVLLGVISGTESKYLSRLGRPPATTYYLRLLSKAAVEIIKKIGVHGFEFTWSKHTIEEKSLFLNIIQAFKFAIDADASNGSSRLIFGVAMPGDKAKIDVYGRDIKAVEEAADFLSIKTHGYHGSWEEHTGFNAPLFEAAYETGDTMYLNVDWAARYYFSMGVSKSKINLEIPTYARTYTLKDERYNGPYAAANGAGMAGDFTGEPGLLANYEVCDFIARGAKIVRVPEQRIPYAFLEDQWVSYEDVESVREKACYARKLGFGGVGVWTLDMDDFSGMSCGQGKYPLLSTIYNVTLNVANSDCSSPSSGLVALRSTSGADANLQRLDVMDVNLLLLLVLAFYTA